MSLKLLDAQLARLTKQQEAASIAKKGGNKKRSRAAAEAADEGDNEEDKARPGGGGKNFLKQARADIKNRGQRVEQAVKLATLAQPKKKSRKLLKKIVKLQQQHSKGTSAVPVPAPAPPAVEPLLEPAEGFDRCLQRAASILINISERSMMKVLHLHCGGRLAHYLGQSTVFDITGASVSERDVEDAKARKQYTEAVLMLDGGTNQFRPGSFQAVVCLTPIDNHGGISLTVQEALRLVTSDGFVLLGASEDEWEEHAVLEQLEAASGTSGANFSATILSLQLIDCGAPSSYMLGLLRKTS